MRMKSGFAGLATLGKSRLVALNSYKKTKLVPVVRREKRKDVQVVGEIRSKHTEPTESSWVIAVGMLTV